MTFKRAGLAACSFLGIGVVGTSSFWLLLWPTDHLLDFGFWYWLAGSGLTLIGAIGLIVLNEKEREAPPWS